MSERNVVRRMSERNVVVMASSKLQLEDGKKIVNTLYNVGRKSGQDPE
jgi:hypothetical protein